MRLKRRRSESISCKASRFSVFDDSSLFLIPIGKGGTAKVLLREMFLRILP